MYMTDTEWLLVLLYEVLVTAQKSHYPPGNHHADTQAIIKVSAHQYQWLAGGYDLDSG